MKMKWVFGIEIFRIIQETMKLIDKSALVAEFEARYNECLKRAKIIDDEYWNGKADAYRDILVVLNTIEVKEVNLVEELDYADYIKFFNEHPNYSNGDWGFEEAWTFGQYCYTLGLKAQKGE